MGVLVESKASMISRDVNVLKQFIFIFFNNLCLKVTVFLKFTIKILYVLNMTFFCSLRDCKAKMGVSYTPFHFSLTVPLKNINCKEKGLVGT